MILLTNIVKQYDLVGETFTALKGVSASIAKGEFVAIVGPSGCGKSTMMHLIGLLDKPTSGKIEINNQDVSRLSDEHLSKLRNSFVGFIFQQFNLINKLTILENILLPTIYRGKDLPYDPKRKAMDLLERFEIAEKANSYPNRVSGGQQQRVAIARALIMNPDLILADEPTGNLDTKTGSKILEILKDLNKKDGVTIVMVTHDSEVARQASRQINMRDGEIVNTARQ